MSDFIHKKDEAILTAQRPNSQDVIGWEPDVFPFDAVEFDNPNKVEYPTLSFKYPWRLEADYIASSGEAWNYIGDVSVVPTGGYYSALRYPDEYSVSLLNIEDDDILPCEDDVSYYLTDKSYSIGGAVKYDLSAIPSWGGGYTAIVYNVEFSRWEYLSGSGASKGSLISYSSNMLTVKADNVLPLTLPFTIEQYSDAFRDLVLIPQNYTETDILNLIGDSTKFVPISGLNSSEGGFVLSSDGFYWYSGSKYIKLAENAIFNGVDLKSGDWNGTITDGEITAVGTTGWALSSKGDLDASTGTFRGDMEIGSDTSSRQLHLGSQGLLVEDVNDEIIHDLPDSETMTGFFSLGHLYYLDPTISTNLYSTNYATDGGTWTEYTVETLGNTNVKGVLLSVYMDLNDTQSSGNTRQSGTCIFRPSGSSWSGGVYDLPSVHLETKAEYVASATSRTQAIVQQIIVPTGTDSNIEFLYETVNGDYDDVLRILQLGVYI